jgi:hypothetical protein
VRAGRRAKAAERSDAVTTPGLPVPGTQDCAELRHRLDRLAPRGLLPPLRAQPPGAGHALGRQSGDQAVPSQGVAAEPADHEHPAVPAGEQPRSRLGRRAAHTVTDRALQGDVLHRVLQRMRRLLRRHVHRLTQAPTPPALAPPSGHRRWRAGTPSARAAGRTGAPARDPGRRPATAGRPPPAASGLSPAGPRRAVQPVREVGLPALVRHVRFEPHAGQLRPLGRAESDKAGRAR